ncbi:MAG TPA: porin family protein [Chryseolinea sp.]|nr:porin family protein [Chryseolinea sp.]
MKLMKREFGKWCLLTFAMTAGVLTFSFQANAQQDESTTQTTVTTQTTTSQSNSDRDRDTSPARARAGIKGGMNLSNFTSGEQISDKHSRVGFHAGVFGQLFVNEGFAIQPELNYSTKGNEVTHEYGIIDAETKFNLGYLDMPVLAVFKLGNVAEIHAGPYWAYLLSANIDTDGDLGDDFVQLDRKNFDNWDYGLAGGIGFNLGNVQLGARYNYGLNEIAKSSGAKRLLGGSKNSVGQIYLAFNLAAHNK